MDEIGNVYGMHNIQFLENISSIDDTPFFKFYMNGETPTFKITTKDGVIFECGINHEISIVNYEKKEWCAIKDLVVGDKLIIQIGGFYNDKHDVCFLEPADFNYMNENVYSRSLITKIPELELTSEMAYFMGVLSCSCICVKGDITINCTPKTSAIVSDILTNVFNIFDFMNFNNQITFHDNLFERWMFKNDLSGYNVSRYIRRSSRHIIQSFMQGMEQTDAKCYKLLSPFFIQQILALYRYIGYNMMYDVSSGTFKVKHNIEMFQEDDRVYVLDTIEKIERSHDYMFDIQAENCYYMSGNFCRTSTVEIVEIV